MNKKLLLLAFFIAFTIFSACSPKKDMGADMPQNRTYADYIDTKKRIATQAGDVYSDVARDLFKADEVREYTAVADMLEALRGGKVDAILMSDGYVKQMMDSNIFADYEYLWVSKDVYINEAGPIFHKDELRDKYNEWFDGIAADGTWQDICNRWIGVSLPEPENIPKFELTGENGTLKMCDTGNYPPLSYIGENGELVGFDVEMASRFAEYMGMKLKITTMSYDAIVPYIASGKADMSACTLTVTKEREDNIIFGRPSVITQAVLIVPKR